MNRRRFLKASLAATGAAAGMAHAATSAAEKPAERPTPQKDPPVIEKVDVLVCGGGTAGTIAALQAARAGASTMLVELGSQLGGTITTGGVAWPGLFHAWGKQIIAGIGWELVTKTVELDGGVLPDCSKPFQPGRHPSQQVMVNLYLYAALAEELCLQAGIELRYYEFPLAAEAVDGGWRVEIVGPGARRMVTCRQLVDCTGGADVTGLLGFARLRDREIQPGSLMYAVGNAYEPGKQQLSKMHVPAADSTTSETRTRANIAGRAAVLKHLRTAAPKGGRLVHLRAETAVRETYRIVGETIIMDQDYTAGRRFEDAVCHAFYPVDLHETNGSVKPKYLADGVVPTVPLRALIPKGSRNLLVAGRSVSSERLANSGLRVQAACMAMGQAAGAAAALAAQRGVAPLDVPLADLRVLLAKHGAILP